MITNSIKVQRLGLGGFLILICFYSQHTSANNGRLIQKFESLFKLELSQESEFNFEEVKKNLTLGEVVFGHSTFARLVSHLELGSCKSHLKKSNLNLEQALVLKGYFLAHPTLLKALVPKMILTEQYLNASSNPAKGLIRRLLYLGLFQYKLLKEVEFLPHDPSIFSQALESVSDETESTTTPSLISERKYWDPEHLTPKEFSLYVQSNSEQREPLIIKGSATASEKEYRPETPYSEAELEIAKTNFDQFVDSVQKKKSKPILANVFLTSLNIPEGTEFEDIVIKNTSLYGVFAPGLSIEGSHIYDFVLEGFKGKLFIKDVVFENGRISGADFKRLTSQEKTVFRNVIFSDVDFSFRELNVVFENCKFLGHVRMHSTLLSNTYFVGKTDLSGVEFDKNTEIGNDTFKNAKIIAPPNGTTGSYPSPD